MFTCVLLGSILQAGAKEADFPLAAAEECHPRLGLPNFYHKISQAGAEVKIGYLGGSITAQPGWRPKSLQHFQQSYPKVKFSEINAAIGGTGSDLGVFRLQQDVLHAKPDLLFVEFAVNDGGAAPEQIFNCMEGIVRQTWRALPRCDICFVYTVTEALVPPLLEGKFPRAASAMERVAAHYGIPSIHLAMEVAKLAQADRLLWKAPLPKTDEAKQAVGDKVVFAPDGVHPHPETGHELYLQAIQRSLPAIEKAHSKAGPHELGVPSVATNYEQAKLLPIGAAKLSAGASKLDAAKDDMGKRFSNRLSDLHRLSQAGDSLTFKFKGTRCAIYDVIGPDCGQVSVVLDDQPAKLVARFDAYCTYARLATLMIGNDLKDEVHTVTITLTAEPLDKAKILSQRQETIDKPERFAPLNFYPGAILLVGEMIP